MSHKFSLGDIVNRKSGSKLIRCEIVGTPIFNNEYACEDEGMLRRVSLQTAYPESDLILVKRASVSGGARKTRRRRNNKKRYSRRR